VPVIANPRQHDFRAIGVGRTGAGGAGGGGGGGAGRN